MTEHIANFIHDCSEDSMTQTVATTALISGFWQLGGNALTAQVPSTLLFHPHSENPDPVDNFIRSIIHDERENEPRVQTEGPFMNRPLKLAPRVMQNALRLRRSFGRQISPGIYGNQIEAEAAEEKFRAARNAAFGYGCTRCYSKAWHPEHGLLTDADDHLILRLNNNDDRVNFCHDLLEDPGKIMFPEGLGTDLFPTPKSVSLSGALPVDLWNTELAARALSSGMPFIFLPHTNATSLEEKTLSSLQCFATIWKNSKITRVEASPRLPVSEWTRQYHQILRKKLAALPIPAEFPTLQVAHQLEGVCMRIVGAAAGPTTTNEQSHALLHDLFHLSFRGLVIGMASPIWFEVGLQSGEDHNEMENKAAGLLRRLRKDGAINKTALLKNILRSKRVRDTVVDILTQHGLICEEDDNFRAISFGEFVEGLYASSEFPEVETKISSTREKKDTDTTPSG